MGPNDWNIMGEYAKGGSLGSEGNYDGKWGVTTTFCCFAVSCLYIDWLYSYYLAFETPK